MHTMRNHIHSNEKVKLRTTLEELASSCLNYVSITKDSLTGAGSGKTKLDKERIKLCQREIVSSYNLYKCKYGILVCSQNLFRVRRNLVGKVHNHTIKSTLIFSPFFMRKECIGNMARNLRALVTKNSMKERFKTTQNYLQKLKFLIEDVSINSDFFLELKLSEPLFSNLVLWLITASTFTAGCIYLAYRQ